MDTKRIFMDPEQAEELHRKYLTHRHYDNEADAEIRKACKLLARGELIVQALSSIPAAGLGLDGYPKLALANASAPACWLRTDSIRVRMKGVERWSTARGEWRNTFEWPRAAFGAMKDARWNMKAMMPLIPASDRPKRGLENYHVLWEAEWEPVPPSDPYLLRRIGRSDLWLVCAMWDLSDVEKAVLAGRIGQTH